MNVIIRHALATQDMGEQQIEKHITAYNKSVFDYQADPITGIIINAIANNPFDKDQCLMDLRYAIDSLTKASDALEALDTYF